MKLLFVISLVCLWAAVLAIGDRCSYDFCSKEELANCENADKMTREQCNNRGGLYITYRKGAIRGAEHKCCQWRMNDITQKFLYCVRNVRGRDQLCTSETIQYNVKIKTKEQCNTLSCT